MHVNEYIHTYLTLALVLNIQHHHLVLKEGRRGVRERGKGNEGREESEERREGKGEGGKGGRENGGRGTLYTGISHKIQQTIISSLKTASAS